MVQLKTYKQLVVWQKAIKLVEEVYKVTDNFPVEEKFGLVSQMRRSAISIPSNIAEGSRRGTTKGFKVFLFYSFSSGAELETQIEISKRLPLTNHLDYNNIDSLLDEVMKMLNTFIQKI